MGCGEIHNEGHLGGWALKVETFRAHPLQTAREMDFPASKSIRPAPYKKTGTLVILWTRDFKGPFRDGLMWVSQI